MHVLAVQPGQVSEGDEAIDLAQTPGDIVVLSAADSDLTCLSRAAKGLSEGAPSIRLANLLRLSHPLSVDLYVEQVIAKARFVCVRLLGGRSYWPYGLEELSRVCRQNGAAFAALLSDDADDPDSAALSTVGAADRRRLLDYLLQGGAQNARNLLLFAADRIGAPMAPAAEPAPMPEAGLYWPGASSADLTNVQRAWTPHAPVAALVFYRHVVTSGATAAIDAIIAALQAERLNPLPIFAPSLKNPFAQSLIADLFARARPEVVLNTTAFAAGTPGEGRLAGVLERADAAVLQVVMAQSSEAAWRADARGLGARDLAMNVALPEVDGRILAGAAAFKAEARYDPLTQCGVIEHAPAADNIRHIVRLAKGWADLRRAPPSERRVALILANYPNRDGRLGNGVGLDTPESAIAVFEALEGEGYDVAGRPATSAALMRTLTAGPTNAARSAKTVLGDHLPLADYLDAFEALPEAVRRAVRERWGEPSSDPFFEAGGFRLAAHRFGKVVVGVQPARGYNIDPKATYHDPALPPPHGYIAFYVWLRRAFGAHAFIHLGKHGNLEWLPGKALALSDACFPTAIVGPTPQLYPFIVNDPGEGSQAKRRIGGVIVDHLTPPLTRAESYGPLKALEALVDEYYAASGMDRRRLAPLKAEILDLARASGLDKDAGVEGADGDKALVELDNYLCELKEMQIRDGLHVFTRSPTGRLRDDLLVALTRTPRRLGEGGDASLIRSLASDLALSFDPLDCRLGEPWAGARPEVLAGDGVWRTMGDTVERLEALALALVAGERAPDPAWTATTAVLDDIRRDLGPRVDASGAAEREGLLRGLAGRFVAPGPSGAPTRGRPDVLPTGRNFYSVDTRAVPTPTAWKLGFASAQRLVEDHWQRSGDHLRAAVLSAWGTANMRTGGDDIAQALALMGARPTWDLSSGRVTGFEVLPLALLNRPRVDVTLRISGFFRDAFVEQIELIDAAARAVMALDEDEADNPAAARFAREVAAGADERQAGGRIFGARPSAYGAGLQAMIDERLWRERRDLAEAFLVWGGHAYGGGAEGVDGRAALETRLAQVDAVVHNQDNREHDLLDSDDYYQFEGGLSAAVEALTGAAPTVYHNDHSRPERPVIRTLDEEIARVVRARVVNPKWIAGVMRHGYKGAFEIAASVDYLFAFAATTNAVKDHHFDMAFAAFIEDEAVRAFMADANPHALRETCARLTEAIERGLWRPRSNSARALLAELAV